MELINTDSFMDIRNKFELEKFELFCYFLYHVNNNFPKITYFQQQKYGEKNLKLKKGNQKLAKSYMRNASNNLLQM